MKSIFQSQVFTMVIWFIYIQLIHVRSSFWNHQEFIKINQNSQSLLRVLTQVNNNWNFSLNTSEASQVFNIDGQLFILTFQNNASQQSPNYNTTQIKFVKYSQQKQIYQNQSIFIEGIWEIIAKDFMKDRATCLFLASNNSDTFIFINISQNSPFQSTILKGSRMNLPPSYQMLSLQEMKQVIIIAEQCTAITVPQLTFNTQTNFVYRILPKANKTTQFQFVQITTPDNNFDYLSASSSFKYYISSGCLYELDLLINTYGKYINSITYHSNYIFLTYNTKLILMGYNSSMITSNFIVTQTIYFMYEQPSTGKLTQQPYIVQINREGNPYPYIPILTSKSLTNILFYKYFQIAIDHRYTCSGYSFDESGRVTPLIIQDYFNFVEIWPAIPIYNFVKLGEDALIIRNNILSIQNQNGVENVYLIRQNTLSWFGNRIIPIEESSYNFMNYADISLNITQFSLSVNAVYKNSEDLYEIVRTQYLNKDIFAGKNYQVTKFTLPRDNYNGQYLLNYQIFLSYYVTKIMDYTTIITIHSLKQLNLQTSKTIPKYELQIKGHWLHMLVTSSPKGSCRLFYNQKNDQFGLLKIDSANSTVFKQGILRTDLPDSINQLNHSQISHFVSLQQQCGFLFFQNSTSASVYKIQNYSIFTPISSPIGYIYNKYFLNYKYLIFNRSIYSYDGVSSMLKIKLFSSSFINQIQNADQYQIYNYQSRVIVVATNYSQSINRTIYFMKEDLVLGMQLFDVRQLGGSHYIQVKVSNFLTKVLVINDQTHQAETIQVISISVDYTNSKTIDLYFKKDSAYSSSLLVNAYSSFYLCDQFFIIRDANLYREMPNPNYIASENIYLFVKNLIFLYNSRLLANNNQIYNFKNIVFDKSKQTNFIYYFIVYWYNNYYYLDLYDFGIFSPINLDQHPPLFVRNKLQGSISFAAANLFRFITINYDSQNVNASVYYLGIQIQKLERIAINKTKMKYQNIQGSWHYHISNDKCLVLLEWTKKVDFSLLKYNTDTNLYQTLGNITFQNQNNSNISVSSNNWKISDNCDRIAINQSIYAAKKQNIANFMLIYNQLKFNWVAINSNLSLVCISDGILKINSNNTFYKIITYNSSKWQNNFNLNIYSFQNRIAFSVTSSNAIQFFVYAEANNETYQLFLNYSNFDYNAQILLKFNQKLTTVLYGGILQNQIDQIHLNMFYIDYSRHQNYRLTVPTQFLTFNGPINIQLTERYLYMRQLANNNYSQFPVYQGFYYIDANFMLKQVFKKSIYAEQAARWVNSYIQNPQTNDQIIILTQLLPPINLRSTSSQITYLKQMKINQHYISQIYTNKKQRAWNIVNDTLQLCPPGCSSCIYGKCTDPLIGYLIDYETLAIIKCGQLCLTCSQLNTYDCLSCVDGTFLTQSTCQKCANICKTCESYNKCLTCSLGFYLNNSTCYSCFKNCQICKNKDQCSSCKRGYVLLSNGQCGGCSTNCSSCFPNDISYCSSCDSSFQLINGTCLKCPSNCLVCINSTCIYCQKQYHVNNGSCFPSCKYPCEQCTFTNCIKCYTPFVMVNSSCQLNVQCKYYNNCTNCGQLSNFYIDHSKCQKCPKLDNCIQCLDFNPNLCAFCDIGYFINSSSICVLCPLGCSICLGPFFCIECISGYTLSQSQQIGECIQCQSPCKQCSITATNCTSCLKEYYKNGWKCLSIDNSVGFVLELNGNIDTIKLSIYKIIGELLKMIGQNSTNLDVFTIFSIKQGSVHLNTSFTPTLKDITQSRNNLLAGLQSKTEILNFTIIYFAIEPKYTTIANQQQSSNFNLILGVAIGISIGLIALIIIIICLCKARKYKATPNDHSQDGDQRNSAASFAPTLQFNQDYRKEHNIDPK